jgi:ligand-binding SRPBCC domain-containing protein
VPAALDAALAFFADAANLEGLTPAWLQFSIVTPLPIVMRAGLEIEYRLRLRGLPLAWRSRIDVWEPGRAFVDRQIAGPYLWWRHEHRFEEAGRATRVIDEVEYLPRAAWMTARCAAMSSGSSATGRVPCGSSSNAQSRVERRER